MFSVYAPAMCFTEAFDAAFSPKSMFSSIPLSLVVRNFMSSANRFLRSFTFTPDVISRVLLLSISTDCGVGFMIMP